MFGKRLAELRNNLGISQYELAARMNLSRGQIANYEQGTREPDFNTLTLLADFFEVSLDSLLGRESSNVETNRNELINIIFIGQVKEHLTEEETDYLKEALNLFRKHQLKWKNQVNIQDELI
ncbi:HTH-type transcriptional regulator ImmR [compost metagenome]